MVAYGMVSSNPPQANPGAGGACLSPAAALIGQS